MINKKNKNLFFFVREKIKICCQKKKNWKKKKEITYKKEESVKVSQQLCRRMRTAHPPLPLCASHLPCSLIWCACLLAAVPSPPHIRTSRVFPLFTVLPSLPQENGDLKPPSFLQFHRTVFILSVRSKPSFTRFHSASTWTVASGFKLE